MGDLLNRVTEEQDFFKKILSKVPGFSGYIERSNRRSADKLLRDTIADRFELIWQRISDLQRQMISNSEIEKVDDLESAALKLRQFIDRVRNASYGYAGFFDAIKIKEDELANIYAYDLQLFDLNEEVGRAVDNIESSFGTDGLPAAIRHLVSLAQKCVEAFDKRKEEILKSSESSTSE